MESVRFSGSDQALSSFAWTDIPPFALIAGSNGVGKTQLLELLASELSNSALFSRGPALKLEPRPTSIGYLPALWRLDDVKVSHELFTRVAELTPFLEARPSELSGLEAEPAFILNYVQLSANPPVWKLARRLVERLYRRGRRQLPVTGSDVLEELDTYDLVRRDSKQPLVALAETFYAYVNARVTLSLRGMLAEQIEARLGEPPWDEANRLLRLFEARFQLTSPNDLRFTYELRCHFPEDRVTLNPRELSSGEQAVLALIALVVTTSVLGIERSAGEAQSKKDVDRYADDEGEQGENDEEEPSHEEDPDREEEGEDDQKQGGELLLLDEPDAHLHTSRVRRYLDHLEQLTKRGVQIIMVTHRPDTIALAPEGSLFEMRREGNRTSIVKVSSKAELIGRLAAETIAVLPGVRVVLVEDDDDRKFHQWAYDRALELGKLSPNPRLVFMPVNARGGGGKAPVMDRLASLQKEGLGAVHRGLIDGDNETAPAPPGVVRLERYTLESYLVDPIALYWAIVGSSGIDETAQLSAKGGVDLGHLHTLRVADGGTLQRIADLVLDRMEQSPILVDRVPRKVTLHGDNGPVSLDYRRWIFSATKSELRTALGALSKAVLGADHLNSGPARSGFVPEDLIAAYRRLAMDPS